jgi:16S rRNA (cytidine1402-2'-O)-methyltransferase
MLYVIATPIGNLNDMTMRAIETLKAADFVIAENPATSGKLLKHFGVPSKPMHQFAEHNEQKVLGKLTELLKNQNGCLVTDAGTPGISDPGFRLVRACAQEGIKVVPIPGANAAVAALSVSGLPTDKFTFIGFLPRTEKKLSDAIKSARETEATLVAYESPFRIMKSLESIGKNFPDAKIVVGREITKMFEDFLRGSAKEILGQMTDKNRLKGEFTVLISFK